MSYKEKLDALYVSSKLDMDLINSVNDVDFTFDFATSSSVKEFSDFVLKFMNKYNIGGKISKRFWGIRGYRQVQQSLYDRLKQQMQKDKPVGVLQLYDDLQDDVTKKGMTKSDIARVARTEGKAIAIVYKLENFKKGGLKYVRYRTRGDAKVGDDHAVLNGREYEIDYLLSPEGEKDRIPLRPNCRCTYDMSMRGV